MLRGGRRGEGADGWLGDSAAGGAMLGWGARGCAGGDTAVCAAVLRAREVSLAARAGRRAGERAGGAAAAVLPDAACMDVSGARAQGGRGEPPRRMGRPVPGVLADLHRRAAARVREVLRLADAEPAAGARPVSAPRAGVHLPPLAGDRPQRPAAAHAPRPVSPPGDGGVRPARPSGGGRRLRQRGPAAGGRRGPRTLGGRAVTDRFAVRRGRARCPARLIRPPLPDLRPARPPRRHPDLDVVVQRNVGAGLVCNQPHHPHGAAGALLARSRVPGRNHDAALRRSSALGQVVSVRG